MTLTDTTLYSRIIAEWFDGTPVEYQPNLTGQRLGKNGYILGDSAGPDSGITNLFHEMGHLADRHPEKLILYPTRGWGYTHGIYNELSNNWVCSTEQAVLCEARCWAYQISLCRHYGVPETCDNLVASAHWLGEAWLHFVYKRGFKLHQDIRPYTALSAIIHNLSITTHTYDDFKREWWNRIEVLRNNPYSPDNK
jgi:hypothetical protein